MLRENAFWIDREERDIVMFEFEQKRVDLQVFIESSILINRVGIKKVLRIKVRCIKRCRRGVDSYKTSMYQGRCRTGIEKTMSSKNWLDVLGYVSRGIKKNPKEL